MVSAIWKSVNGKTKKATSRSPARSGGIASEVSTLGQLKVSLIFVLELLVLLQVLNWSRIRLWPISARYIARSRH